MSRLVLGKLEMGLQDRPDLSWLEVDAILYNQATPEEILRSIAKSEGLI